MKSYMQLCEDCDWFASIPRDLLQIPHKRYTGVFGHLIEPTVKNITWDKHWEVDHAPKTVKLLGDSLVTRSENLGRLLVSERDKGTFKVLRKWTQEDFPIYGPERELVTTIERAAASLFGVQLIVYRDEPEGISIWAARRSPKKVLYPSRLSVTVGGSLPARETPFECLVREAHEEAGLSSELVKSLAKSVGTIGYVTASDSKSTSGGESGLIRAEVQFIYDMKVGTDVVPTPYDMEASDISLYTLEDIKKALNEGEFTPANACLMLDFFIRHGLTTFNNETKYTQIVSRLHRPLGIVTV